MPKWLKQRMSMGLAPVIPGGIGRRSDEGHPSAPAAGTGDEGQAATEDEGTQGDADKGDEIDWKAEARKHEKRAKANAKAAEEYEKLRAAQMSEQEKAVAAAKAEGATEAMKAVSVKLAAAELRAEAASKGVDLSGVGDLIDVSKLLDENGDVDAKAVKAAVARFAKLAPAQGSPRGGGDFGGGPNLPPASLDAQILDAEKRRDFNTVIRLKRQKAAQT